MLPVQLRLKNCLVPIIFCDESGMGNTPPGGDKYKKWYSGCGWSADLINSAEKTHRLSVESDFKI